MNEADRLNIYAYLATIGSIVLLALAAAAVCIFAQTSTEVNLARIIGGLAFITSAISGLTGIAGTFRPSSGARPGPVATTQTGDVKVAASPYAPAPDPANPPGTQPPATGATPLAGAAAT